MQKKSKKRKAGPHQLVIRLKFHAYKNSETQFPINLISKIELLSSSSSFKKNINLI
jgi:hypothetical protein